MECLEPFNTWMQLSNKKINKQVEGKLQILSMPTSMFHDFLTVPLLIYFFAYNQV